MRLLDFLKPRSKTLSPTEHMALAVFPGGYEQVLAETRELFELLEGALSVDEAKSLLTRGLALLYPAADKSFDRCKNYIISRSGNKLSEAQAQSVYCFFCKKLGIAPT